MLGFAILQQQLLFLKFEKKPKKQQLFWFFGLCSFVLLEIASVLDGG